MVSACAAKIESDSETIIPNKINATHLNIHHRLNSKLISSDFIEMSDYLDYFFYYSITE